MSFEKDEKETNLGEVHDIEEVEPSLLDWVAQKLGVPPNDIDGTYPAEVHFMAEKFAAMTEDEALVICKENLAYHQVDPNFREEYKIELEELLNSYHGSHDPTQQSVYVDEKEDHDVDPTERAMLLRYWATIFYWWSPYPEVRSVTDPFDDVNQTTLTWRVYVVGTIWVAVAAFVNTFFHPRQPAISLSGSVCQLLLYPSGRLLQYALPDWGFTIRGKRFTLNPGVWSQKEQLLCTIMVTCALGTPYITSNVLTQYMPIYYNQSWAGGFGYSFLMMLVTQYMGFGLAGLLRRVCVYPVKSMWPTLLPTLAVNKALLAPNRKEKINGWSISRYYFFFLVFCGSFLYFWIPNYLWEALSTWNWMTWIAPNNDNLAIITGSVGGLGYNPIPTFDWNIINFGIQPILLPLYTSINMYVGVFISGFFIMGIWYSNNNYTKWIPINTNTLYDNTGKKFKVTKILTDYVFDEEKYKNYSPPYYSAANLVTYGAFFAIYPLSFVYTVLCNYEMMWVAIRDTALAMKNFRRSNYEGLEDPFSRHMKKHKEVPDWWFYVILLIMFGLSIALVEHWPTNTPVWVIVLCLGLVFVFIIPFTLFLSFTGVPLSLNVLAELIVGYALPGKFQALNLAKALSVQIASQAQNYASDQKLVHYSHLAPRDIFATQLWATLVNGLVALGVMQFQMHDVKNICEPDNAMKFTCPSETTFFSASIIWGVIGPKRIFDHQYPTLKWMFLLGAGVGLLFWFIQVMLPKILLKYKPEKTQAILRYQRIVTKFHPVIFCQSCLNWAPYNLSYFTGGLYAAIFFNGYVKTRFLAWWRKYAYVFSAGMDTGIALSGIIIFFAVQYNDYSISWWGNNVPYAGVDTLGVTHPPLPDVGYFGPGPENYP
ncbi:OPT oligopeptide transporter protein-domain-containing protein [Yarrowia lipolytica]|jgi:OPT family small oligopeptide transporter|uniref:YALI0F09691p n=2 Tax=Yarrowia lipolytica TaxID=4952 RepID=Q6C293_YARLI|nr:YALI0F09691p [Yarrowia lipolytica CLIB122]AOW06920.1 hypothetical protein YALI1_F13268g [Yarrowia lipolytica]KAB8284026.1 OPT oligopeptide transporter protein-domain-containing protein [Yarrowia lipolytica]KAE8173613.1 OPT oligopeptide transporter protein-domain-containing protein [Yarrowia lipolytica]KAJ8055899.1 OPT oligopeptide transporter protein-domain-containing protein [Yarrowia lipolytica]QNQ00649.1 Oligopeptide transporter 2 [Yarrowia lipolytica]|eukprot:XP_505219.1 YALI0F09691p [Yarrowia lipolytica CLIB122]